MRKRELLRFISLVALAVIVASLLPSAAFAAGEMEKTPDYTDLRDFENALRGRIARLEPPVIYLEGDENKQVVWDLRKYDFIPTVNKPEDYNPINPETIDKSLWRLAQLNKIDGLFEVCEGVYQVRGYDLANMTIIEGKTGVIIIDSMSTDDSAKAALKLYSEYKGTEVKVSGIIITHSHVDHYGGIAGSLAYGEGAEIYAPEGFMEATILENAFVGDAMTRRATFMYGTLLPPGEGGQVDAGLGKNSASGNVTLASPTVTITQNNLKKTIDGVNFEFLLFPGTEAPAEMTVYIPSKKLLVAAELSTHTLHNILTPRGAEVRDTRMWWKALDTLITEYGDKMEVLCSTHHWPTWGAEDCNTLLGEQRDTYKFMHDQTIRLINKGYTMLEIAAEFEKPGFLPEFMETEWHNRGYYGTISHNVRAIYQKYLGWYDMNPSNLNPLPPEDTAKKYVEALGGEEAVAGLITKAAENGELRWAAELGKHLVFSNPSKENREILAAVYERLGYESEAATWRNMYITGAAELRKGGPLRIMIRSSANPSTLMQMEDELLYDFIASRFMAEKATGFGFAFDIRQTDRSITHRVESGGNGVLNFRVNNETAKPIADVTGVGVIRQFSRLELDRSTFVKLVLKTDGYTLQKAVEEEKAAVYGPGEEVNSKEAIEYVNTLFELTDVSTPNFNIVQP